MFRRKEEGDTTSPESSNQISMSVNSPVQEASSSTMQQTSSSTSMNAAPVNSYAPSAQGHASAARPAAAATTGGNYRPAAPLSEFSRNTNPTNPARSEAPVRSSSSQASSSAPSAPSFSAFSDKSGQKTNRRVLTVGNDILLKGEIATCDRLVIEGRVEAKLSEVHTVEIAECGSFKGTAEVEDAEISGVFEGDLVVRNRLVIYSAGEVRGNITYGEIEIERGGRLTGQIKTVAAGSAATVPVQASAVISRPTAQEVKARVAAKEFAA